MTFYFDRPYLLLPGLAVPLLWIFLAAVLKRKRRELKRFYLEGARIFRYRRSVPFLLLCGVTLLIIALSGPVLGTMEVLPAERTVDVVIALDGSASMGAEVEGDVTRFDLAKKAALELAEGIRGVRVGLVIFGDSAAVVSPLTYDPDVIAGFIERLRPGILGNGTSMGAAVTASSALFENEDRGRAIVILSDGGEGWSWEDPAVLNALHGDTRVFTVGIGPDEKLPIPLRAADGRFLGYRLDPSGKRVFAGLNSHALRGLAERTGGRYFQYFKEKRSAVEELSGLVLGMGEVEKGPEKVENRSLWFRAFLIVSLFFIVAARVSPLAQIHPGASVRRTTFERPVRYGLMLLCLLLLTAMAPHRDFAEETAEGVMLYNEGRLTEAEQRFKEALEIRPDYAPALFGLGAVRYSAGRFEEARRVYSRIIETGSPGDVIAAQYNMGCTLFRESKFKEAYTAFKKTLVLAPDDEDARFNLEVCLNILRMSFEKFSFGAGAPPPQGGAEQEGEELEAFVETPLEERDRELRVRKFMESLGEMDAEGVEVSHAGDVREFSRGEAVKILDEAEEAEMEVFARMLRKRALPVGVTGGVDW